MSKFKYSLKYRKEQLRDMKKLLKHYIKLDNGRNSYLNECPLCYNCSCDDCVWMVETKHYCHKDSDFINDLNDLRNQEGDEDENYDWLQMRLEQLVKWIAKYEEKV